MNDFLPFFEDAVSGPCPVSCIITEPHRFGMGDILIVSGTDHAGCTVGITGTFLKTGGRW